MSKRHGANGVFDVHVCGATSGTAELRGVPVVLVTGDGDILEAAGATGYRAEVLTVSEYEALLDGDRDALVAWSSGVIARKEQRRRRLASAV